MVLKLFRIGAGTEFIKKTALIIVAKNIIVFYDYKDTFKEVAIWKFGTEEEMNKVYKVLADKLKQTTEEIIIT